MATGRDICSDALLYAGITSQGDEPSGEDIAAAARLLNDMLGEWSARRWIVYALVDRAVVCTANKLFYTVGPGGDIEAPRRPERIEAAYVRLLNGAQPGLMTDYPLDQILSREDYSRITLKQLSSFPYAFFYDPAYPLGNVYAYPLPNSQYALHVLTRVILENVDPGSLANDIILPQEYDGALKWNLARRCRAAYRYPPSKEVNAMAANGINVISSNNFAVPTLQIPPSLKRGGRYNFYSDTVQ